MNNDISKDHSDDRDEPKQRSNFMKENQNHQGDKMDISDSSKKFAQDLIKTLTVYIDIVERVEEEYKKFPAIIARIEKFYTEETKKLDYYKILLAKKKLTRREINDNANHIQETLEAIDYTFGELMRVVRMQTIFFPDEEDRTYYDNKINKVCFLFNDIYQDIQDVAFEEQDLTKNI